MLLSASEARPDFRHIVLEDTVISLCWRANIDNLRTRGEVRLREFSCSAVTQSTCQACCLCRCGSSLQEPGRSGIAAAELLLRGRGKGRSRPAEAHHLD